MWHWADKRLGVRAAFIFRHDPGMSDFNTIPWKIMILGFTSDTAGENITRFVFCVCKAHNRVWVNLLLTAVRRVGGGVCVRVCVCRCIDTVGKSILKPFDMFRIDMDRYFVTPAAFFLSELFQAAWISAEHLKTVRWNETEALRTNLCLRVED